MKREQAERENRREGMNERYHMRWRSPQDLNPECCFD